MAFTRLSNIDGVVQIIDTDGAYIQHHALKGAVAQEFGQRGCPLDTVVGLDFCKCHVFDDPVG